MKNSKLIIGVLVLIILALVGYVIFASDEGDKASDEVPVETGDNHDDHGHGGHEQTVNLNQAQYRNANIQLGWFEKKNLSEVINANGYTKLPPQNQADVSVFTSGLIKSIKVIEGEAVKKGQVLATVESPEFAQLQQDYLIAKSNLEYLQLEYERQQELSANDVNAKKVVQKTKNELEVEQARFNSLEKQLAMFKINGDGATVSSIPVLAPISGHITEVYVNIGTSVEQGKVLFSIVDNSEMHVDLLVYEKDLFKVKEGQEVHFVLTNQSNKEINGTIFNVGKSFENETKTVAVHAHIEDKEKELIPGMYVNALIDVGSQEVRTLPEDAVVQAEGREFIFVYEKENDEGHEHDEEEAGHAHHTPNQISFARVEVKTGPSQLGYIQVTPLQKIHKGDKIVTSGAYYLQSHLQKSEGGGGHSH